MNASMLRDLAIVVPPRTEQNLIATRIERLTDKNRELTNFVSLSQTLVKTLSTMVLSDTVYV